MIVILHFYFLFFLVPFLFSIAALSTRWVSAGAKSSKKTAVLLSMSRGKAWAAEGGGGGRETEREGDASWSVCLHSLLSRTWEFR